MTAGFAGGLAAMHNPNLFGYVEGNPVMSRDPFGYFESAEECYAAVQTRFDNCVGNCDPGNAGDECRSGCETARNNGDKMCEENFGPKPDNKITIPVDAIIDGGMVPPIVDISEDPLVNPGYDLIIKFHYYGF